MPARLLLLVVALAIGVPVAAAEDAEAAEVAGTAAGFAVAGDLDFGEQQLPQQTSDGGGEPVRLRQEVEALRFELQRIQGNRASMELASSSEPQHKDGDDDSEHKDKDSVATTSVPDDEDVGAREKGGKDTASDIDGMDSSNPAVVKIDALPHQKAIAIVAAVLGGLSVVGPSSYVRFFLTLFGSAVGGLMVASCYSFIREPPADHEWLSAVFALIEVQGSFHTHLHAYMIWGGFLALGLLRWLTRWECGFYDVVEEVQMGPDGRPTVTALLRKPLLPPVPPPPPAGVAVARDEV